MCVRGVLTHAVTKSEQFSFDKLLMYTCFETDPILLSVQVKDLN